MAAACPPRPPTRSATSPPNTSSITRPRPPAARWLFYLQGIADRSATPAHEVDAHLALLLRGDGGRAFQRIVRGFEPTAEKERLYTEGLADVDWPAWSATDERYVSFGDDIRSIAMNRARLDFMVAHRPSPAPPGPRRRVRD